MEFKKQSILNEKGQSAVEYLLLLVVVTSLSYAVFKNPKFKEFFGQDSSFFAAMRDRMQYSYRHGLVGFEDNSSYTGIHDTYATGGSTRFIAPVARYPQ